MGERVTFITAITGTVEGFDRAAYVQGLSLLVGVPASSIGVQTSGGSVIVSSSIDIAAGSGDAVTRILTNASTAALESYLGVQLEGVLRGRGHAQVYVA